MVGLKDVAREAGVSASTVSRVLTNPALVNAETRERVRAAMAALDYRPNQAARRLRGGARGSLIGLVVPDIQNPFFAEVARGVERVAQTHGYGVFVGNSDEDEATEQRYLELMRAEQVDGVILPASSGDGTAVAALAASGMPVVCVDRRLPGDALDTVVAANVAGARAAVQHLLTIGHERIGFVGGRAQLSTTQERLAGYRQAHAERGLAVDESLVHMGDSREAGGRRLARALLRTPRPPTALFVGNNLMTLGALEAIHTLDLRIPDDVAVVGYDDMPWAAAFNPPLTTVRQPGRQLGRRAAELLLARIEDPARPPSLVTLDPELIVRESCGAGREAGVRARVARERAAG